MSILIKGIEKPNSCANCPFERDGFPDEWEMHCLLLHRKVGYYGNNLRMPTSCPIVEVPTPHGRLKDGDMLESLIYERVSDLNYKADAFDILRIVQDMRPIIEAEEGANNAPEKG